MDNKTKTFLRNCLKDYGAFYLIYDFCQNSAFRNNLPDEVAIERHDWLCMACRKHNILPFGETDETKKELNIRYLLYDFVDKYGDEDDLWEMLKDFSDFIGTWANGGKASDD